MFNYSFFGVLGQAFLPGADRTSSLEWKGLKALRALMATTTTNNNGFPQGAEKLKTLLSQYF